ncbi:carboxypeptidase-like regulatory domain-containing protein [Aquimarina hainanensis]|uniref:Carboxypeptidase-like regulatory domain-containing protein n=1 Tax=Aquimarina hainanensis TaxID=1578017 RepID=A0ABW5N5A0_9FLAO
MKLRLALSYIIFSFFLSTYAQEYTIEGTVSDPSGTALSGVNLIVYSADTENAILSYGISDDQGVYTLSVENRAIVALEVSYLGYKTVRKEINFSATSKNVMSQDFVLEKDLVNLETVAIVVKKYKDTVRIKTDSLRLSKNASLRDVLNKSDGFDINDDGYIAFNGVPITKVLINKKEVFVNQNSIALDNIDYGIIDNLQVINNYKDRFDVDFSNFTEPVINIDTKKEFRGVLKFTAEAGYGYKNSFLAKGRAMFFSDNFNAFLTQNTNNIFEKDFKFKNISSSFKKYTSQFFRQNVSSFLNNQERLKKDITNNTSLTIRKEATHYKTGGVIYFNYIDQLKNELINTKDINNTIREETLENSAIGNLSFANFYINAKLLKNTSIRYELNGGNTNKTDRRGITTTVYIPNQDLIDERNKKDADAFITSNEVKIRSLFNDRFLLYSNFSSLNELSESDYSIINSQQSSSTIRRLSQYIKDDNRFTTAEIGLDYKYSKLLTGGVGFLYLNTSEKNNSSLNTNPFYTERRTNNYSITSILRGQGKRLEYSLQVSPTIKKIKNTDIQREYVPITTSLLYKISPNKNISASYTDNSFLNELSLSLDTIATSFNTRVTSAENFNLLLNRNRVMQLQYSYSNIAKSKFLSSSVSHTIDDNFIQPIFDRIDENTIIFYNNTLLKRRNHTSLSLGAGKGFYFSENYHKISFDLRTKYSFSDAPTIIQDTNVTYKDNTAIISANISLEPQNFFLDDISITSSASKNSSFFDDELSFEQKIITNNLLISSETKKLEYELIFFWDYYDTSTDSFHRTDIDFNSRYNLTKKTSLFIKSKSILNLLKITPNNINSIQTETNGALRQEVINTSLSGYFLFGITHKF